MRKWIILASITLPWGVHASIWDSLWQTRDQHAQKLMKHDHFKKAEQLFDNPAWRAAAAYRAGNYKEAAKQFQTLDKDNNAPYNQGNAQAFAGQYEQAIQAYDRALKLNPQDSDARYNRSIIEELLKKKQDQQKQDQQKQDQQRQDQQKQDQQKQDQQKQDQQKQDQQKQDQQQQDQQQQDQQKQDQQQQDQQQQDQQKQDQQKQDQQKQDQQKQDQQQQDQQKQDQQKQDQQKQDQQKQDQQKQDQQKQDQQKQDQQKQDQQKQDQQKQDQNDQEKQRAKQQWLQLIPDEPGGLLRQKFLRDHLRKQNGWNQ